MSENLYLLGHPISHSKSPAMYNALYKKVGISWDYDAKDCETDEAASTFLNARDFLSVNITTPYKPLAFQVADVKASTAKLAQGANVLINHNDALIAYNVDGEGCVDYLERTGFVFSDKEVVVCGTGPTALSILHACALAGARRVIMIGRDKERTCKVLEAYVAEYGRLAYATIDLPSMRDHHVSFRTAYRQTDFAFGSYRSSKQVFIDADLVINATPLGMNEGDPSPCNTDLLHEGQTVFDAVYGHGKTALFAGAQASGATVYDGAGMLVSQAVATAVALMEIKGVDFSLSRDEMFNIMAKAAQFDL